MLDPARVYDTELAALCVPGEDVKAALSFIYSSGQELTAQPTDDRVSFDPFDGLDVPTWNRATERLIGGVSLDARQGTDASFLVGSDGRGVRQHGLGGCGGEAARAKMDQQVTGGGWKAKETAFAADRTGRGYATHLVAEERQEIGRDVRVLVVQPMRATVETEAVAFFCDAVAADTTGRFKNAEGMSRSARVEAGGKAGGAAAQDRQHLCIIRVSADCTATAEVPGRPSDVSPSENS